jgi:uncharacterized BrkB/YihY/UPF0761 family membrane protein
MDTIRIAVGWVVVVFVAALGGTVLVKIWKDQINLNLLLGNDKDGDASMSRFQLMIFTFVVVLSFFYLVTAPNAEGLPDVPGSVLTMLGISGSAYLVAKGIDAPPGGGGGGQGGGGQGGAGQGGQGGNP